MKTNLALYDNRWYQPGSPLKRLAWYFTSLGLFESGWFPLNSFKVSLLRLFGAVIGRGVIIKPHVRIKYPWLLTVGDHAWIGEGVWIDNLAPVTIGANACLSQECYLLTGNHDFTSASFDLLVKPIVLEEGVWIGAKATVCPGVTCYSHAVLAVGSVATRALEAYTIYQGNPAQPVKKRVIRS